ncbi:hypothetical protein [Jeotgalibacillus malaysiensis]|uniref:hypothetical protein n=1 Tax=Jeotgalibacillus malaysiensis TaxID=1508404 RepID=UPI00384D6DEF
MIELEWEKAKKKAKKYKKLFEDVIVHTNVVMINNVYYFEAAYLKKRSDKTEGKAIVAGSGGNQQDALTACEQITIYHDLMGRTISSTKDRARISPVFFSEALEVSKGDMFPVLDKGEKDIRELQKFDKKLKSEFSNFREYVKGPNVITQASIDYLTEIASSLAVCQINMMRIMADFDGNLAVWNEEMKAQGLWRRLSLETKRFYSSAQIKNEQIWIRQQYKEQPSLPDGSFEDQRDFLRQFFYEKQKSWLAESKSMLRAPKL